MTDSRRGFLKRLPFLAPAAVLAAQQGGQVVQKIVQNVQLQTSARLPAPPRIDPAQMRQWFLEGVQRLGPPPGLPVAGTRQTEAMQQIARKVLWEDRVIDMAKSYGIPIKEGLELALGAFK